MAEVDWDAKDRRIAKLAVLKAVIGEPGASVDDVPDVIRVSNMLMAWVYEEKQSTELPDQEKSLPVPTPKQKELLDKIQAKYGHSYEDVFRMFGHYPTLSEWRQSQTDRASK